MKKETMFNILWTVAIFLGMLAFLWVLMFELPMVLYTGHGILFK